MTEAFYERLGDESFRATSHTAGPWDPRHQHAGPPSALLARAVERRVDTSGTLVHRFTVDILGPVPVGEVTVRASVTRPGRRVRLVDAELRAEGRVAMRAAAWLVAAAPTGAPAVSTADPLPGPDGVGERVDFPPAWSGGYLDAVEWRPVAGDMAQPGPATVWGRPRVPLVGGEDDSALGRLLTVADSGSGVSGCLDLRHWLFVNTDLTVHLHRPPTGPWVGLDAATTVDAYGAGTASAVLYDTTGPLGRATQALVVVPRT